MIGDFAVAFGSVFVSVAIFYSFDVPSEWKIPNIIIPIIAVFVYRILGRFFGKFWRKHGKNSFSN
ncbi:MAG: hypothetical protein CMM91_05525 [Rickettsiales bacterium]|nr:hypothetical protein [Rickettsiales bacterium]